MINPTNKEYPASGETELATHLGRNASVDQPVRPKERIVAIDALRGFALLGILLMNIQSFSMIAAAYLNPLALGELSTLDFWLWLSTHSLADMKFMTLFSALFGVGIVLVADRQTESRWAAFSLHYRRMFWLLLIGLAHAYLFWYGDILVPYAVCGAIVFWFRKLSPAWLLVLGLLSVSVASGLYLMSGFSLPYWPEEAVQELSNEQWQPTRAAIDQEIALHRGTWMEQLPYRAETSFYLQTFVLVLFFGWRITGLMLIGMAAYRWGFFRNDRTLGFYLRFALIGALVGWPLILYGVDQNFDMQWKFEYSFFIGSQFNYWGSLFVSLCYASLVLAITHLRSLHGVVDRLAAVGRMALTNYLMQTLMCTLLFYGHGLGQFMQFNRLEQFVTVLAIWSFQLIASPIWLRYFRFGPAEWAWRSVTYARLQPMRY